MPVPMTRPIQHKIIAQVTPTLPRGSTPGLNLPPSNGVSVPGGTGQIHTVADPANVVPVRTRT